MWSTSRFVTMIMRSLGFLVIYKRRRIGKVILEMYGVRTAELAEAATLVPSLQATADIVPYKHIAWRDNEEPGPTYIPGRLMRSKSHQR